MTEPTASETIGVLAPDTAGERPRSRQSLAYRLMPRAGARTQLLLAAVVWLVGATILGVRGAGYLLRAHWAAWLLALALVIGIAKGHLVLDRVARKAVARIRVRDRDGCLFGFFSWKSWLFILVMMGGGIVLRNSGAPAELLGVVYAAVATALAYADRIYWHAVFSADAATS